jgi:hypothetical protein
LEREEGRERVWGRARECVVITMVVDGAREMSEMEKETKRGACKNCKKLNCTKFDCASCAKEYCLHEDCTNLTPKEQLAIYLPTTAAGGAMCA